MQKILKLLEQYVEWVAVALAAAFLGWMIYAYVVQKPVVASVGGTALTPGEIDQAIKDGPVLKLQAAMQSISVPPMPMKDFVTELTQQLTAAPDAVALNGAWTGIPLPPSNEVQPEIPQQNNNNADLVKALPEPAPAPVKLEFSQGRSNVMIPPPLAPDAAPVAGQGTPADRNWVTIGATIPMKSLAKLFKQKNIPPGFDTTLLRVQLIRQEEDANGNWGSPKTLPPLQNVSLLPLPSNTDPVATQIAYKDWAEKGQPSQISILQPPFYQVLQADPWYMPGQPPPTPIPVPSAEPAPLSPDAEKAAEAQKRAAAAAKWRASHPQSNPGGMGPGGPGFPGGPGGPAPVVADPDRPLELAQAGGYPPGYAPPGAVPGGPGFPGMPGYPGGQPYPGAPFQQPQQPGAATPAGQVPAGSFDPNTQPDVTIWAHDDSVQAGHTYRYQLQYIIVNPVWRTTNVCNPPTLADQFSIASENSAWTNPITVKSESNLFAINTSPGHEAVRFEIFRWKNGAWQSQTVEAEPGDVVGTPRGDGDALVNFTTGLILVGVRSDPKNPENKIVILTSESGQLERHDVDADRNSDEYKKLKDLLNTKPPAAAAASPPQANAAP